MPARIRTKPAGLAVSVAGLHILQRQALAYGSAEGLEAAPSLVPRAGLEPARR